MNRAFRLIWSAARGACVVAPETARGRGSVFCAAAGCCAALLAGQAVAQNAPATVRPVPGPVSAFAAPNGVPVVNINNPNGAGLSRNLYTRYDVDQRGLVLNNSLLPSLRQSQLAGGLMGNPNLASEARIILNEVVSANRSTLAGFTEVLGRKADVIVANPYGLTCSGCGFINSDRVTLATGTPAFGADGGIAGFNVSRGDVLINGGGLNASAQQILDIVTRSVRIDGQINTAANGSLAIVTGNNQWRYASRDIGGATAPDGAAPALAIDSSALGGMYAGRIRLIATEAGVGVRMLGDAAASVDDFRLDGAGRVALHGRISAARDLQVRQTNDAGAASLELSGATAALTAGRDLALSSEGGITIDEGMLRAGASLSLQARSLADRSAVNADRSAGTSLDAQIAGRADIDGSRWAAGGALALQAGSLSVGALGTGFYSGEDSSAAARGMRLVSNGEMTLLKATLISGSDLALSAQGGALNSGAGVDAESTAGMALTARTALNNEGRLLSAGKMRVDGIDAATVLTVTNRGVMQAGTTLAVGEAGMPVMLANAAAGRMLAGNIAFQGTGLDNAGLIQADTGIAIRAAGDVVNRAGGTLLDTGKGKDIEIESGRLDNAGTLQSAGAIKLDVAAALANSGIIETTGAADGGNDGALALRAGRVDNSGTIASAGSAALNAADRIDNSGLLQAQALSVKAGAAIANRGAGSRMLATGDLTIASDGAGMLDNAGIIQAGGALRLGQDGSRIAVARNADGAEMLGNSLLLAAGDLDNAGLMQANTTMDLEVLNQLDNRAGARLLLADEKGTMRLQAATLANSGSIQSAGSLSARAAADIDNSALMQAAGALDIGAGAAVRNKGPDGRMLSTGGDLSIAAATLDNGGRLQAARSLSATIASTLFNSGIILNDSGAGLLTLSAGALNNRGVIQADGAGRLIATAGNLQNSGEIAVGATLDVDLAAGHGLENNGAASRLLAAGAMNIRGSADISNQGRMQAGSALSIGTLSGRAGKLVNSRGAVLLGDSLAFYTGAVSNSGSIGAQKSAMLDGGTLENLGKDAAIVVGNGRIALTGNLLNQGVMHGNDALAVRAAGITNAGTAGMSSAGDLTLTANVNGIANDGALYAGKTMSLSADGQKISNGDNATMDAGDIWLTARTFANSGQVEAKRNIAIRTTESFSNLPVGSVPEIISSVSNEKTTLLGTVSEVCVFQCPLGTATVTALYEASEIWTEKLSAPFPSSRGRIIAGGELDIDYGGKGSNTAALLSAPTLKIHSSDMNARAFVNQDLHLDRYTLAWRWKEIIAIDTRGLVVKTSTSYTYPTSEADYKNADGSSFSASTTNSGDVLDNVYRRETSRNTIASFDAGIFANTLSVQGGTLINRGSPLNPTIDPIGGKQPGRATIVLQPGSAGVALDPVTGLRIRPVGPAASAQPYQGLNLGLPTNPNGFFVQARDPAARYLVETNPLFVNGVANGFLGSDYLADLLGYQPDALQKRLGDASYEARLIREQIVAQTGSNLLRQQANEATQARALMEQGAAQSSRLGLTFGKGLTPEQIARLEQDLVWMVEEDVGGTPVLVPVVYLAQSTRQAVISGAVIEALDMRIQTTALENAGGTIRGGKVEIAAAGDVINLSGTIAGQSMALASAAGSVLNKTDAGPSGQLGRRAAITSQGDLSVSAAKDVALGGATLAAGGNADVLAGRNVEVMSARQRQLVTDAVVGGTGQTLKDTGVASGLEVGGTLAVRSGADLTVEGSNVTSGKNLSLDAGRSLRIVSGQDVTAVQSSTTTSGAGVGGGVYGTSTTRIGLVSASNAASSVSSGGSLDASAADQLLVRGSSLKAQGDLQLAADTVTIDAGRNIESLATRTDTSTYLKLSSEGQTAASATAKAASDSASETSDKRSTQVDGREVASTTATSKRSAGASTEIETGKALAPDPERKAVDTDVTSAENLQQRSAVVDDRGKRIVSTVDTQSSSSSKKVDDGDRNMNASSSSISKEDSVITKGRPAGGPGSTNSDLAAKGSAAASASAGASAEANGKAGLALVENTSVVDRRESNKAAASDVASGGKLTISGRKEVRLQGAKIDAAGDAVIAGDKVDILATQDTKTASTTRSSTAAGFLIDSANKAGVSAAGKANAEGSARLATGGKSGDTGNSSNNGGALPGKVAAEVKGSASASGDAKAEARSQNNIDIVRDLQTTQTSKETVNTGSTIRAGANLEVTAGNILKAESADLQGERQVALKAKEMEFLATQDLKESTSTSSKTSGGLYVDGGAKAQAQGSAALKGEARSSLGDHGALNQDSAHAGVSGSLDAKGSATANAKGGAGLQFKRETAQEQQSESTANVTTIRSGAGDISRNAEKRIVDVGTKIDAAGNFSQEANAIDSRAASNTSSSSSKTQSDTGKLGVYGRADAEASGSLQISGGAGAGYTGNTLDKENKSKTGLDANAGAGIEAEYEHKDGTKSASSSTAVVSSITAGGRLASKSTGATTLEGTAIAGQNVDLQAGSLDMKAARNTSQSSEQETEGGGKISGGVNAGTGSPVTGALSGNFDRTTKSAATSDAVVGSIRSGQDLSIRTRDDARLEGTGIEAGGNARLEAGGKLELAAAQSTRSTSEETIHGAIALSATKSDSGSDKGFALEGSYAKKTEAGSKATVADIAAGGDIALSSGGNARLEGSRLSAGGNADVDVKGDLKFDAARDISRSESFGVEGSVALGATTAKNTEKGKQSDSSSFGLAAKGSYEKSDSDKAVTGGVSAGGDLRLRADRDAALEGTDLRAGNQVSASAGRDMALKAATDSAETTKLSGELALGAGSKTDSTLGKDGATTPDNKASTRSGALGLSGDYSTSTTQRGGAVQAGAGGAQLGAGRDLAVQGGSVKSEGDVALTAAGDMRLDTATSTVNSIGGSLGVAQSTTRNTVATDKDESAGKKEAGIRGGINQLHEGTAINSGGRVVLKSGGATSMTNTETAAVRGTVTQAGKGVTTATVKDRNDILNLGGSVKNSSAGAPVPKVKEPAGKPATPAKEPAWKPATPAKQPAWKPAAPASPAVPARPDSTGKTPAPVIGAARAAGKAVAPPAAKKPLKPPKPVIGHARKAAVLPKPAMGLP